jgi:hypothetical protein
MRRPKNTVWISISMQTEEKVMLDELVRRSGKTRNRFLRDLFAHLWATRVQDI